MIQSFECDDTHAFFIKRKSRRWSSVLAVALRKLDQVHAAQGLDDLRIPPGNQLEALGRDRKGQHSIRINDQYRICFNWEPKGPTDVEITDYH